MGVDALGGVLADGKDAGASAGVGLDTAETDGAVKAQLDTAVFGGEIVVVHMAADDGLTSPR